MHFDEPRLWSPDEPNLYEGRITLEKDGETDEVCTYFGIREISSGKVDGRDFQWILLNGKPVYLNGTLDQAFNPTGFFTYPDEDETRAEAWRLEASGAEHGAHSYQAGRAPQAVLDGQAGHSGDGRHSLLLGRAERRGAQRL